MAGSSFVVEARSLVLLVETELTTLLTPNVSRDRTGRLVSGEMPARP